MKRTRFWLLGTFVAVTALLVGVTLKARQSPLYQLSHYPKTRAFERYVFDVSTELETPITPALVSIDEPASDFSEVLEYKVSPGVQFDLITRDFRHGSGGSGRTAEVSQKQFAEIERLVSQLPPSTPPAKREDLLVVLLYQPAPTQIRLYNRRNPPPQLRAIVGILTAAMQKDLDSLLPRQTVRDVPHLRSKLRPSDTQRP